MGNLTRREMDKLLKRLLLFAAEIEEIETTTYESIGDGTNNNNASTSSSPENSDDFVLVPNNLPVVDAQAYDRKYNNKQQSSPPRPSTLPISEPKPVPTTRKLSRIPSPSKPTPSSGIPRSQPINMKQSNRRNSNCNNCDINSISPPSVQFAIGTPPSNSSANRRRSTSGCGAETPPVPPSTWQISPSATSNFQHQSPSALRRSGTVGGSPMLPSSALAKLPALSSPTLLAENNNNPHIGTRAFTLPDMGAAGANGFSLLHNDSKSSDEHHTFFAPELPAETLLDREHNETLAKLNFVLALTDCILEVADSRCAPLSALMSANESPTLHQAYTQPHAPEHCKRAERLILLIRALQLLSSGLSLASHQLNQGHLKPSNTVKNVLSTMNTKYRTTLSESKKLNASGLLQRATANHITADKILYDYAIQMCQTAALDELFGNPEECFTRYQSAQILLHSLAQKCTHPNDKQMLNKYKDAVEKRLYILQKQGYIYSTDSEE